MAYHTFQILVNSNSPRWIEVVACDYEAAKADLQAAYGNDVEILQWKRL